jgi:neurofibromin 1
MNGDAGLVGCLVDRLATRLPHRTGTDGQNLPHDDILHITRTTLVDLSRTELDAILYTLLSLLEELSRPYAVLSAHPSHVLLSEVYLVALAADCCQAHWAAVRPDGHVGSIVPQPLHDESLVARIFDVLKTLLDPISDTYILPAQTLLGRSVGRNVSVQRAASSHESGSQGSPVSSAHVAHQEELDGYAKLLVEFISASNWAVTFDYFRKTVYSIRSTTSSGNNTENPSALGEIEKGTLVVVRLLSFFWVDAPKLGLVMQELCSSYLHFRKAHQSAFAIVTPLLIMRWIERCPHEFVQLHQLHRRLDGGVDTLFDMTYTAIDSSKRNSLLYPLQTSLLLLLPDVFEVASNLREAKSGSIIKKVSFLDSLRKSLKNGNEQAGYCLVSLLRSARHFDVDSDSALVSYAMDFQDEVRDAVFHKYSTGNQAPVFGQDMMTASFVNLAYLNPEDCAGLIDVCITPGAPQSFKIAAVQACCYFVQNSNAHIQKDLFRSTLAFIKAHLEAEDLNPSDSQGAGRSTDMLCSILQLFDAYPTFLVDDLADASYSKGLIVPFLLCVVSSNSAVRQLASGVAKRLFLNSPAALRTEKARRRLGAPEFIKELWARSSKVLLGLHERIMQQQGSNSDFTTLHDYLQARLLLLENIPVSYIVQKEASNTH